MLGELRAGFRLGRRAAENEAALQRFLRQPAARVADVDDPVSTIYAEIVADLRQAGTPVPTNDIWIAAIAVREGGTLLSFDDHFQRIRRVGLRLLSR